MPEFLLIKTSNELAYFLKDLKNEGIEIQIKKNGIILIPISSSHDAIAIRIKEKIFELALWDLSKPNLLVDILNDEVMRDEVWKLPKEDTIKIFREDNEAVFNIVELLNLYDDIDAEALVKVLVVLSEVFPIESVFENLLNLPKSELSKILEEEGEGIIQSYRRICF